jgi:glycosyltransferase involved in cell wall biosynthesis
VTINLNNLSGLRKTIESVFSQDYDNIQYLIIDGGSEDGSVDFIKLNHHKIDYWISEKDKGIYDAMNKGIIQAKGEYILFLNSGDYFYCHDAISKLVGDNLLVDIVYGNIGMYKNKLLEEKTYPTVLTKDYFQIDTVPHQATLIKRNLFLRYGFYNINYKIVSDWIFFWDVIIKYKASYRHVDQLISIFDLNGVSSQPSSYKIIRSEINQHLKQKYWFTYQYFKLRWAIQYYPKRILMVFGFKYE